MSEGLSRAQYELLSRGGGEVELLRNVRKIYVSPCSCVSCIRLYMHTSC